MKLYYSPSSPFVRKTVVLLHEMGKSDEVELATVATTPFAPDEGLKAGKDTCSGAGGWCDAVR